MSYRHFSADREALAKQWITTIETPDKWEFKGFFGTSESKPFVAERADGLRGLAKPGVAKPDDVSRAAHEKIASDLAYHLNLPVAPAVLCGQGSGFPLAHVVIAAWAFDSCDSWDRLNAGLSQDQIKNLSPVFSAIAVFETWISASDRNKGDASLINGASGTAIADPVGLAFYDYAFSMSQVWVDANSTLGKADSFFPPGTAWDVNAGRDVANKIASLNGGTIYEIVSRVPANYLTDLKKSNICANLRARSGKIHALMGIT